MDILRKIAVAIWRIWFYLLVLVVILVLSPILVVSVLRASWYPLFFRTAQLWARIVMLGMGFIPKVQLDERFKKGQSYMLVSNHASMTDILLMLHVAKNPFVFVGKAELGKLPIFGFFYKRTCILVDRGNARSRKAVFDQAQQKIKLGYGICIFPEGGVPGDRSIVLDTFKDGAFRLAIEHQIPVVPMTFFDTKRRFPFVFTEGSPGKMRVHVHTFMSTKGLEQKDRIRFRESVREVILKQLQAL